jgi:opacity protein-like surface antigen
MIATGGAVFGAALFCVTAAHAGGATDWSGFHAGVSFGVGAANTVATPAFPLPTNETLTGNTQTGSSFTLGANAGYDRQFNALVIGAYGELDYLHIATQGSFAEGGESSPWGTKTGDLLGSARIRIGGASKDVMVYGSGGLAMTNSGVVGWNYEGFGPTDFANNGMGYVLGGGIEYRLNEKMSVNLDYSHYVFSASNAVQIFTDENMGPRQGGGNSTGIDVMKLGLNYHF